MVLMRQTIVHSTSLRGAFSSTGLSYMVAPRRTRVRDLSRSKIYHSALHKVLYCTCSPTCACTGEFLAVVAWQGLGCPFFHPYLYDIFSTYTCVWGSVSIHNLRTVAPRYGELYIALRVYLTGIKHM
jgi:hypothetical protein